MQKLRLVRTGKVCEDATWFFNPHLVYMECRYMEKLDREHVVALHLDGKNRIIAKETVSIGSLNEAIVEPREVFKAAVHNGTAALVVVHNHPSGDPTPSREDIGTASRLNRAGEIIGIEVLDHIIIGSSSYYSMKAAKSATVSRELVGLITSWKKLQSQLVKAKQHKKASLLQLQAAVALSFP